MPQYACSQLYRLFKEFIIANIIWPIKDTLIDDLISQKVEVTIKQKHFICDLSTVLRTLCLSPLFSTYISKSTGKIRSLLLFGPRGSGKGSFVEAMAASTGSTLFRFTRQSLRNGGKAAKILKHDLKTVRLSTYIFSNTLIYNLCLVCYKRFTLHFLVRKSRKVIETRSEGIHLSKFL